VANFTILSSAYSGSTAALTPGTTLFADANGVLTSSIGAPRGQGAINTNPSGGVAPLTIWSSTTTQDPNDFGHSDRTLLSVQEGGAAYSAATRGPLVNLVRYHATADASTLVTTILNIATYSPASTAANQESSGIFISASGRANGLSIYKNNNFRPIGYTDESTFNAKSIEIGHDDAGTAVEVSVGYTGTKAYQTQALRLSLGGTGVGTLGTKGLLVGAGVGTNDARPAIEVGATFVNNASNTGATWSVTLAGDQYANSLLLPNAKDISAKDTVGTARAIIGMDAGNNTLFGPRTASGGSTLFYGNSVEGFRLGTAGGFKHANTSLAFFGAALVVKQTVSGAKGSNAALGSLIAALVTYGIITDTTTA